MSPFSQSVLIKDSNAYFPLKYCTVFNGDNTHPKFADFLVWNTHMIANYGKSTQESINTSGLIDGDHPSFTKWAPLWPWLYSYVCSLTDGLTQSRMLRQMLELGLDDLYRDLSGSAPMATNSMPAYMLGTNKKFYISLWVMCAMFCDSSFLEARELTGDLTPLPDYLYPQCGFI